MSYVVLARKYRPKQFSELVGQQHVAQTLINAFRQNKLGQAYLLTGTRGVGKTSVARIFAKALRCESPDAQPGGKNPGISCDKCPSCLEINAGASIDVLEIDGASNNGVENVREIREQVKFLPSRGRMKVYIIDEVHMLTNAAFNALLKTLEEPPAHVTFILATTEVQKIPATILSRCQRFDFRRVPQPLIQEHLSRIADLEKIKAEPAALRLVARKADGSVRDSLSALDQCLALGGKELNAQNVSESLGIVSSSFLVKLLGHAFKKELAEAATMIRDAFLGGVEMKQIALGLAESLRDALFVKLRAMDALAEVSDDEKAEYEALVQHLSPEAIQAAYRLISTSLEEILRSPLPRASLEMALARLSGLGQLKSMEDLLRALQAGGAPAAAPAASAPAPSHNPYASSGPTGSTPASMAEKKSPSGALSARAPSATATATAPAPGRAQAAAGASSAAMEPPPVGEGRTFVGFVGFVLQQKASLGALLEHSIPVTPDDQWLTAAEVKLGFRKSHAFYQLQAQHKVNFEQLERCLNAYLQRRVKLSIEAVADTGKEPKAGAPAGPVSLVEREKQAFASTAAEKKKRFLEHAIVRDTKEIFGAELSSFDIDTVKT